MYVVTMAWRHLGLHHRLYEGAPGMLAGFLVFGIVSLATRHQATRSNPPA